MRMRSFGPSGRELPILGQGTWNVPTRGAARAEAVAALRRGIDLGMTHIDTAEMYGSGAAEDVVAEAISGYPRDGLFLASKVLPSNASARGTIAACEASLRRLRTRYIDLYLLHWRGGVPLAQTMGALERLVDDGKIRMLGVSNFDVEDMEEARAALARHPLACNQVCYHLDARGVEHRVIPYARERGIAIVGYSPFGSGSFPSPQSAGGRVLAAVAARQGVTPRAIALAFLTRLDGTFAIPKAARTSHVEENARAGDVTLSDSDLQEISTAFPLPPNDAPLVTI